MNIGFLGLGKLGLPCALAIESRGHIVMGSDISPNVKTILETRKLPYMEKNCQSLLDKTSIEIISLKELVNFADMIFIAVQTPHDKKYEGITRIPVERKDFNYDYLKSAVISISDEIEKQKRDTIVIIISTVLPTTIETEIKPLLSQYVKLCYNPFFIAMGTTVNDFLEPEFVLFGVDNKDAVEKVKEFYRTITDAPFYETDIVNAELIKVAYNTFIGMKIVFANTLMEICHKINGADIDQVTGGLKLGFRRLISTAYMDGGMSDGGNCHPRDNIAMSYLADTLDISYDWFTNLMMARERQTDWLADLIKEQFENSGLPVCILGKAYKPETNLVFGSPSVLLKNLLLEKNITAKIYDPYIHDSTILENIEKEPHIFLIGTKHTEFVHFQFPKGSIVLDPHRYIPNIDGVTVIGIGKKLIQS